MRLPLGDLDAAREDAVERYLHLTKTVMPDLAKGGGRSWPVVNDHCFQRIVLDAVCQGTWYDHIEKPAYKHMTREQALAAAALCEDLITGKADLAALNRQSLRFRGKAK